MTRRLPSIARDEAGSVIIEFGILAPALVVMMVGILQVGFAVQNVNAVRSVAGDVARHAMIQGTTGHPMSADAMETYADDIAEEAPYLLTDTRLDADVADVASPQVANTVEKTLTLTYQIPTFLDYMGLRGPSITYSRPIIFTETT